MRIGFDLTSGATLQELSLPENTTLLATKTLMLQPKQGDIKAELANGSLSRCELTLLLTPEDVERMNRAGVSGVSDSSSLAQNLLVEVTFQLNTERLGSAVAKFEVVQEPMDLLFVREENFPVLLNLQFFDAVGMMQNVEAIEGSIELEPES